MALISKTLRAPVGTCDIQAVCFEGSECLAALSGCVVRIYTAAGTEAASLSLPVAASAMLTHGARLSVFGDGCACTYGGRELVATTAYPRVLSGVCRVVEAAGRLVVLHAHGYAVGAITRGLPLLSRALTDGSFYCAAGVAVAGKSIAILAKTLRTTSIIRHGPEAGAPAHTPLPAGNFLFAHRDRLFVVDARGLWECTDRLTFVRELGNTAVTAACSKGSLVLLFCRNGEVFELADDGHAVRAVLVLGAAVTSAAQVGGSLLCGSSEYLYFISPDYRVLWTVCSPGRVCTSATPGAAVRFLTAKAAVAVESKIWTRPLLEDSREGEADQHRAESYSTHSSKAVSFRLEDVFKTQKLNILTYNCFSTINNRIVQRIHSCYEVDGISVFATELSMFVLGDMCSILPLKSTLAAYSGHLAYSYHYDRLLIINLLDLSVRRVPAPVSTEAIVFDGGQVFLVLFGGAHETVDVAGAQPVAVPVRGADFDGMVEACSSPVLPKRLADIEEFLERHRSHSRFLETYRHRAVTTSTPYFGTGGTVSHLCDGAVQRLCDAGSCVRRVVRYRTGLVVCCVSRSFFYDLSTGVAHDFDRAVIPVLGTSAEDGEAVRRKVRKREDGLGDGARGGCAEDLVLIHNNTLRAVSTLAASYACSVSCLDVPSNRSVLYSDRSNTVTTYRSTDLNSFYIQLNGEEPVFYHGQIITGFYIIDALLLSLAIADVRSKVSRLAIVRIRGRRLLVRREMALPGVPLALAGRKNTLAVVLPDRAVFVTLRNGRVRISRTITMRSDYAVEAMFLTATCLAIRGEDWSFRIVSLSSGRSRGYVRGGPCVPFALERRVGWAEGSTLFWCGAALDLGERISAVFSLKSTALVVVGCFGAVSLVQNTRPGDEESLEDGRARQKSLVEAMGGL